MKLATLLLALLSGCAAPYLQPPHTKQVDNCLYDKVYLACLNTAKTHFYAVPDGGWDWSMAEIRCSNMAYSSALRNSPNIEARCGD